MLSYLKNLITSQLSKPAAPVVPLTPPPVQHITRDEILMGRDKEFPLTPALEDNLAKLLIALNKFRDVYDRPMIVSSGYRPGYYNTMAGGAPLSAHKVCMACDFGDADGKIKAWIKANPSVLEEAGVWMEDPGHTPTWVHLDIRNRGPKRVFLP